MKGKRLYAWSRWQFCLLLSVGTRHPHDWASSSGLGPRSGGGVRTPRWQGELVGAEGVLIRIHLRVSIVSDDEAVHRLPDAEPAEFVVCIM